MRKKCYCIYLDENDKEVLESICKKENANKSALFRKFIHTQKYLKLVKDIENYNELNKELLYQIKRYGANLNQIAYHLNTDISKEDEAKNDFKKLFIEFKKLIEEYKKNINFIKLKVSHKK